MNGKKITQQDIAAALGVSRNTVSKVFNGNDCVAEKTCAEVICTADRLGYKHANRPSLTETAGSDPRTGGTIAFVSRRDTTNDYWANLVWGVEKSVSASGMHLTLCMVDREEEMRLELPASLKNPAFRGIITIGVFSSKYYRVINDIGIPWVSIDTACDINSHNLMCDVIMSNNAEMTEELTKALIAKGHSKIAFIGDIYISLAYTERWLGFYKAMNEAGLPVKKHHCVTEAAEEHYFGGDINDILRNIAGDATAIVCATDTIALHVIHSLAKMGYSVPGDIAVTGYDNLKESIRTSLTTVDNDSKYAGLRAAEEMFWRMKNPARPLEIIRVQAKCIYRDSTEGIIIKP